MALAALVQVGSGLSIINSSGVATALTLPTNVTIDATRVPRFAVFNKYVVVTNSPSRPLTVGADGVVRVLSPLTPRIPPILTGVAGGTLSGTYKVAQSFIISDQYGNLIAQSGLGPTQYTAGTIASQALQVTNLDVSDEGGITGSIIYRTTTNGSVFFQWLQTEGSTQTLQDDLPDAALSLLAVPIIGTAPRLHLIAEWRNRLWGVGDENLDLLQWSEAGLMYSWPGGNSVPVPRIGSDDRGVVGLIPRREFLGVGRRDILWQVSGTSNSDFRLIKLSEYLGIESQESCVVYRDIAYFLWKDGVYQWDSGGIKCVSDGKVRSWFNTDSYFNRARFKNAFGRIDPIRNKYLLCLATPGSTVENTWIEYDLTDKTWWGPHKTGAFTPTCTFIMPDANDVFTPILGSSSGFLWKDTPIRTDDVNVSIDMSLTTKFHDANTPDIDKYWGELSVQGASVGGVNDLVTITSTAGHLDGGTQKTITQFWDLTRTRQRLGRVGVGKLCQFNFRQNTVGTDVFLIGYEVPYFEYGKR